MSYLVKSAIKVIWQKLFYMIEHDLPAIRPTLGDYIDTTEMQKRLDYVLFYNPNLIRTEYLSTLNNTEDNVHEYHEKKGLNHGLFRNFSRQKPEQALKILQVINRNIYRPLFINLGKGYGSIRSASTSHKCFTYEVRSCSECLDLPNVNKPSCFFFSGLLAGIFSGMFQQPMGAYESKCGTSGDESCVYEIGLTRRPEFDEKVNRYLNISLSQDELDEVEKVLLEKIEKSLTDNTSSKQNVGTHVHILGYQLRILNALEQNPEIFSGTYNKAGIIFSKKLAPILQDTYHVEGEELLTVALPNYYKTQRLANITSIEKFQDGFLITYNEPLDCAGIKDIDVKPCSFMKGEIEGIATIATGRPVQCDIHSCRHNTREHFCQYRLSYIVEEEEIPDWLKEIQAEKEVI